MAFIHMDNIALIHRIIERTEQEGLTKREDRTTHILDLLSCPVPMRWEEMLEPETRMADIIHDVMGINKHLNRDTCELRDCFLPRFSRVATS